jgi:hypothetical protein
MAFAQLAIAATVGGFQFYYAFYSPDVGPCYVNTTSQVCEITASVEFSPD